MNKHKRNVMPKVAITVVGHVLSESYQKCKLYARKLKKYYGDELKEVVVRGLLEVDWTEYLDRLRRAVGGQTWSAGGAAAFVDGAYVGADRELAELFEPVALETPGRGALEELAREDYLGLLARGDRLYAFFEISVDGEYGGSLLFELRHDLLPEAAARFARLSAAANGYGSSRVHRVRPGGWLQGGDVGGRAPVPPLAAESFCYKHDRRGVLSFVHPVSAQFAVTFGRVPWLDGRLVAFGRLVEGSDTLRRIETAPCTYEAPDRPIAVARCGVAEVGLGRRFAAPPPMMGLTQGDPHVDPASLAELLLESVSVELFERSDDAVKRRQHVGWLAAALWDRLAAGLAARLPPPDVPDPGDRPSVSDDLHDSPDVLDRFFRRLLRRADDRSVARGERLAAVRDILVGLVDAVRSSSSAEVVAEHVVRLLTDGAVVEDRSGSGKTPTPSASSTMDTRNKVKFDETSLNAPDQLSVVGHIWEALLDSLKLALDSVGGPG